MTTLPPGRLRPLAALVALAAWQAAPAAEAAAPRPYTLDTCIISGDRLGAMGEAVVVIRAGREIKLCCRGCIKDFDKDPGKFLARIEQAEKARSAPATAAASAATAAACAHPH